MRHSRSVSIPPEIAKRMDLYPGENWSKIATEAFKTRLEQIQQHEKLWNVPARQDNCANLPPLC